MRTVEGEHIPETVTMTLTLTAPGTRRTANVQVPVVPATIRPDGGVVDVRARITEDDLARAIGQLAR
ncbi:hypothetical protein [Microbacterium saperdae]|uniref:Uncharacterized protein n=1 Tax=Microbacterium saperdae TaxID=69368 RepID=A0A543BQW9_9MICO|nr:hypothetical protein [Microbacterium saperdae]TQL87223.1 hypothetical protein FB560_2890 [Microbacterium saperdae]GGM41981.1 hypothetical protein GCM10010489_11270 [Microbacterium saperdae]